MQLLLSIVLLSISSSAWALEQSGFFELPTPNASGTGDPNFSFNSAGPTPTFVRVSTGTYDVTFANMAFALSAAGSGGIVQANSHEPFKHCNPVTWNNSGANLVVRVHCSDINGSSSNTRFLVAFRRMVAPVDQPNGFLRAYLWNQAESSPNAPPLYSFNSTGAVNTVSLTSTGSIRPYCRTCRAPRWGAP